MGDSGQWRERVTVRGWMGRSEHRAVFRKTTEDGAPFPVTFLCCAAVTGICFLAVILKVFFLDRKEREGRAV